MPSRRRSRNKSIAGNITDVQKRLRYLETRPAPSQLAKKVVATKNIALRAVVPDVIDDAAIVRRTLAPESVISANLSVVGDPDGAAVATENVQDTSITNEKLAGDIEDGKLIGISASKVGPDLLVDDQLESISASKVGPDLLVDDQLDGISTDKLIGSVLDDQIDSISASKIGPDLIQDDQIDGISGEKIIGGVDGALIVDGSIEAIKIAGVNTSVLIGNIQPEQIEPDSLGEDQIATDGVGFDELQADSVGTTQLIINSVIGLIIDDLAVERRHMNDNIIIDRMVNAGAIQTRGLQNLAVTTAKIADSAVTNAKIAGGSVTQSKVAPGAAIVSTVQSGGAGVAVTSATNNGGGSTSSITLNFGIGASQVAQGNHTHSAAGVPSHTHPVSASISGATSNAGAHTGHTGHSHPVTINAAISTSAPSSLKLKKEISDHQPADIKNILNLKLKKYKYKNQLRHMHEGVNREWMHGYIAEEVQELGFEELLGYDEKGEPASLNYGLLSTLVLELVKVQQTEIDSLKEEIQRLKEKI
jgi:hypothetical protein